MPQIVLAALTLLVSLYLLMMGAASLGFWRARRPANASPPADGPTVSILVDGRPDSASDILEGIQNASYPADRIEEVIQICPEPPEEPPSFEESLIRVRSIPAEGGTAEASCLERGLRRGLEIARGDVLLVTSAACTLRPTWIQSMVDRCTPGTPCVIGPVLVEHDDRFLPRLEALHRAGGFALAAGLQHLGLHLHYRAPNLALRVPERTGPRTEDATTVLCESREGRAVFNPEAEAAVPCASASSLLDYLRRQVRMGRSLYGEASPTVQTMIVGVWLTHAVLLACCVAAVGLPAWRQPTLLALLGKMGGDALLAVPSARHFGQRSLPRSFVPSELLLVLTLPLAGLLSVSDSLSARFLSATA